MANITRIKAKDPRKPKAPKEEETFDENDFPPEDEANAALEQELAKETEKEKKKAEKAEKKAEKKAAKEAEKKAKKADKSKKPACKPVTIITWPFRMIIKPFIIFGRYLRDSWREIRQVRWPSTGATWKMVFAVLIYSALLITLIMLLDALFTWLFNIILN